MISFSFVPVTKLDKVLFMESLSNGEIILDLEDSVPDDMKVSCLSTLRERSLEWKSYYVRIPIRNNYSESADISFLESLVEKGFKRFVIPKVKDEKDLIFLQKYIDLLEIIILVEHPKLFITLPSILDKYNSIKGVGLGSHDLLNVMGAVHEFKNLAYFRLSLNLIAKAYEIISIDFASMNTINRIAFVDELLNGMEMGYDGKFIIHPFQLNIFKEITDEKKKQEIIQSKRILELVAHKPLAKKYEPFVMDGIIIEKPHIVKAEEIIKIHGK